MRRAADDLASPLSYEKDVMFEGYTHPDHMYAIENPNRGEAYKAQG